MADVKNKEGMFTRAIELKLSLRRYAIKLTIEVYFTFKGNHQEPDCPDLKQFHRMSDEVPAFLFCIFLQGFHSE